MNENEKLKIKEEVKEGLANPEEGMKPENTEEGMKPENPEEGMNPDEDAKEAVGDTLTPSDQNEGTTELDGTELMSEEMSENSVDEGSEDGEPVAEGNENVEIPMEKTFTQSQVNELVGKARMEGRESALKQLLERYGVNDDVELNDVFGKGQAYDGLNDDYMNQGNLYKDAMTENALLKANVIPGRWDDIKAILGGKNLEVTVENIESMIPSHPEWRAAAGTEVGNGAEKVLTPEMAENLSKRVGADNISVEKPATLRKLGNEATVEPQENEEEKALRLFGMK